MINRFRNTYHVVELDSEAEAQILKLFFCYKNDMWKLKQSVEFGYIVYFDYRVWISV